MDLYIKPKINREVKEEILAKVKAGEPAASVAEKYGVSVKTIYGWLRWNTIKGVSWLDYAKIKRENQQLKEIIGVLTLEVTKSKKRQLGRELEVKLPQISKPFISKALGIGERNLYNQNTKRAKADLDLKDQVLKVLEVNPSYGHRRVALALGIGKKRARRIMRLYDIKPYKRMAKWTKKKDYGNPPSRFPNLIKGSCPLKPNFIFAGDFTRLIWSERIVYLATFMDIFTREIVGWSVSTKHTAELVVGAFLDAIRTEGKPFIVHTDQGSVYNSEEFIKFMEALGVRISMSTKRSPWENACQESFYDNFKTNLGLDFEKFETIDEFVEAIHQTINYYNKEWIHTKLKTPPLKFKLEFLSRNM